jgi:hypothetical protein
MKWVKWRKLLATKWSIKLHNTETQSILHIALAKEVDRNLLILEVCINKVDIAMRGHLDTVLRKRPRYS